MAGNSHMREVDSDLLILNERLKSYINEGMDNVISVAQNVADYCSDNEKLKQEVKDIMNSFIEMERQTGQYVQALKHLKSVDVDSEENSELLTVFKEKLKQIQVIEQDSPENHPKYVTLEGQLTDLGNIEEQLECLRARLGGATDDEEVAMTSVEIQIKCPFTGQTMVQPVRNKVCNHVYDRDGILSYINSRKAKAKCPVGGCTNSNPIRLENLEDHMDMKKYITLLRKLHRE
ncbi:unnamed protein product [Candidula unifasciata]|uniref:E3 SUMO-protein ligase NSE2 n=1 Tax=Candidula unifasciata TaxID=100452 RepID=A0A8S3ZCL9_9EUPU|nr:unnamed protein product [Candidula unifasciata]